MSHGVNTSEFGSAFEEVARRLADAERRLAEVEQFVNYAADVDPEFKKLLAGFQARNRLGIGVEKYG